MLIKNKIKNIKIGKDIFIYRRGDGDFWLYSPQNLEFHRFNKNGFALLLCIAKEKFEPQLIKRIKKSDQTQKFLDYLINHELITKKHLKKLGLL